MRVSSCTIVNTGKKKRRRTIFYVLARRGERMFGRFAVIGIDDDTVETFGRVSEELYV